MHTKSPRLTGRSLGRPEGSSGAQTRARLMEIAATLFAKKGFAGVTLADVAGAAGLTAPSIYNHFGSKDELFISTVTEMYTEIFEGFAEAVDRNVPWQQNLANILEACQALYRDDRVLQELGGVARVEASRFPQKYAAITDAEQAINQLFVDMMENSKSRGELGPQVDPTVAGELLAAIILTAFAQMSTKRSNHDDFRKMIATFKQLFIT